MSKNKELTPVQQLRLARKDLKHQFEKDEERIAANWKYLTHNTGSIFINTIFSSSKKLLEGRKGEERTQTPFGSIGSFSAIASGIAGSLPMIWEIVQPMLIGFVVKKIKGLFSSKKKKKSKKDSDEE